MARKKQEHTPRHGFNKSKGHAPKHLSAESRKGDHGFGVFVACLVLALLMGWFSDFALFLFPAVCAVFICAVLCVTKRKNFLSVASVVLSSAEIFLWLCFSLKQLHGLVVMFT